MLKTIPFEAGLRLGSGLSVSNGQITSSGGGSTVTLDTQEFTASGTWTKPTGALWVHARLIGGGGGGAAGTTTAGGTGGCAGLTSECELRASDLSSTESVTCGAGGLASATGSDTTLGTTTIFARASGGVGANTSTRGVAGIAIANGWGAGGAAANAGRVGPANGSGGGGGGSSTTTLAGTAGGQGGAGTFSSGTTANTGSGGAAGNTSGGAGTAGTVHASGYGSGGGGGGGNSAGTGGAGGAGIRGSGGGGGGRGTTAGGAGGSGGTGYAIIYTLCVTT